MSATCHTLINLTRQTTAGCWKKLCARFSRRPTPAAITTRPALPATNTLTQANEAFKAFSQASDERFTELARALFGVSSVLRGCQTNSRTLITLAYGQDSEHAIASAHELHKSTIDLVHASIGLAISENSHLQEIEAKLLDACKSETAFLQNNVHFRVLAISVKIEASRLSSDDQALFSLVAAQISDIDQRIAATTQRAFSRLQAIITAAATERGDLTSLENTLRDDSLVSINTIRQELDRLEEQLAPCAIQGLSIEKKFGDLHPEVLALITALQSQDIVRQKLEHVGAGFRDITDHLDHHAGATPPFEPPFLTRAARVQREQLREARRAIEQAADHLVSGLQTLANQSAHLNGDLNTLNTLSVAALRGCRVHELFKQQIGELSRIANLGRTTSDNIATLVSRVEDVITIFFGELNALSYDVKLVALNAQVTSARTVGAEALTYLASEAARLSDSTDLNTGDLTRLLSSCLTELRQIRDESAQFLNLINAEQQTLETGFHLIGEKLGRLCTRTANEITDSTRLFENANTQLNELLPRLDFPALVATCFDTAEQLSDSLIAVADDWSATHNQELSDHGAQALARHEGRYTMQSENAIHATVVGAAAVAASTETQATDDMELFDAAAPAPTSEPVAAQPEKKPDDDGMELF
jgi:hypothetical protein